MMKKHTPIIILFCLFIAVFTLKGTLITEPDMGWQIRIGEYIMQRGIPKTDPFSFSMANYPYIDHSWLTSVLISFLYTHTHMLGVALFFSLITAAAIIVQVRNNSRAYALFPVFMSLSILFPPVGVRAQVVSWIGFSAFLLLLERTIKNRRYGLLLPPLIALWANLHGGFPIALLVLGVVFVSETIAKRRLESYYLFLLATCLLATGLNPYGYDIWKAIFATVTNPLSYNTIGEWGSSFSFDQLSYWIFFALSALLLVLSWRKTQIRTWLVFVTLVVLSLISKRHIPYLLIAAIPLWPDLYPHVEKQMTQTDQSRQRYTKVLNLLMTVVFAITFVQWGANLNFMYVNAAETYYPKDAAAYIKKNNIKGRIFAYYGWGGYLLWKVPACRFYIDGRMPEWNWKQQDSRYTGNAYKEYYDILEGRTPLSVLKEKYHVRYALLPTLKKRGGFVINPFQEEKILYQDDTATLYVLQ